MAWACFLQFHLNVHCVYIYVLHKSFSLVLQNYSPASLKLTNVLGPEPVLLGDSGVERLPHPVSLVVNVYIMIMFDMERLGC